MENHKLISLVEPNDILYNKKHPFHKNNQKKREVWLRIAEELGVTPEVCERRWTSLRERFCKELRSDRCRTGKMPWRHLGTMYFLRCHLNPRRRNFEESPQPVSHRVKSQSSPASSTASSVVPSLSVDGDLQCPWTPMSLQVQSPLLVEPHEEPPAPSRKLKVEMDASSSEAAKEFEFCNAHTSSSTTESVDEVAVSIGNVVKKCLSDMGPKKKMKTVVAIMQLLSDAECAPNE